MTFVFPRAVLEQHTAFLGKTGSGKTSTAKLAVEQILAANPAARVCVLDPIKSDWWGMTSSADGQRAGLPFYILGGPRGHVSLHDSAGKAIGELVATGDLPLSIIDMADFNAGGLQKFFNDFAPALMKRMRGVVYLVIEEAHEFAPKERAGIGAENLAIHNAKKLATAGRSKGIRLMVVTQRTQALHNAVLGSCDTMIAHRLTAPADQDPVKKWLKSNVDKVTFERVSSSLASLKTGTGWICSGEAQVADLAHFPKISTFDNSATPTDGDAELQVTTAPVDRDRLRAIIGDAVKQAENEDPAQLRRTIMRLESQLGAAAGAGPQAIAAARQEGFERARREASADLAGRIQHLAMEFQAALHQLESRFIGSLSSIRIEVVDSFAPKPAEATPPRSAPEPRPMRQTPAANGSSALNSAGQKMLTVLDTNPPVRRTWKQVATLAGLKARGGHFNTGKKSLLESGLIAEEGEHIWIASPSSGAVTGSIPPAELVEMWCRSLSGAAPNILRTIYANGGTMTQAEVAEVLGVQPRGGHWNSGWKELRDNDVLTVRGGTAELTELFRP
ncbi:MULTISPECIES: helicase HerA domain-containing protein [unclassified Bradyrhizobium]|uniref:helicase HerA domain-containing protein n=1 Tax=Bradyrhizobium sp. USDA 4541 TaxID=2817704 RepID=UPI0020A59A0F|nr:DUF87 domain-containing protein [Bradyrhizobium sp. USDA 4541]MCP1852891.1 hypothetical protein [Bradyrhizobium sp. USDA 4541]